MPKTRRRALRLLPREVAAACLLMSAIGTLYAWSVFVPELEQEFGDPRATVSLVFSVATVCFTLGMLMAPFFDGVAGIALRSLAACLIGAAGLALAGIGHSIWIVAAGFGAVFGFANGIGYSQALRLAQSVGGGARSGTFTGLAVASYAAGSALAAPPLSASLAAWHSRPTLLLLAAYLAAVGLLVYALIARSGRAVAPRSSAAGRQLSRQPPSEFVVLWAYFLLNSLIGVLTIAHAAPLAAARGGSPGEIAAAAVLVSLGNGVGRLAGGWLSDRAPARAVLCGAPALNGVALATAAVMPGSGAILASLLLVGAGYGCVASALPAIVAKTYGAAETSRIFGRIFTAWGVAGLTGPLLGGAIFDALGGYETVIVAAAAIALAAMLLSAGYPPARRSESAA
ncbi:MAG TPA: MFS transporter [Stellaceae bacterium]|nr:MFS transporter [Stellaceae bacterium]